MIFPKSLPVTHPGFIINEAAANYMGFKNPVGEVMKWGRNGEWKDHRSGQRYGHTVAVFGT